MPEENKKYSNGEITIVWKQHLCTHSKMCWKNLPDVFAPLKRPWINPEGASSEKIMERIDGCPSKALTYFQNEK